ncbi:MAG: 4-(cytidine 5'-diphospho)-2-C-methyl-D-erythritol kinase [Actinomycetota bacterium]|nr:4-(cytidine 5'-diphospho)-2-C-methyl-D-erythritol kinase [Actinomycetota bacterium]
MRERIRTFAKLNYALEVLGVRPDGYHEISTVFQSISLYDEVEIERVGRGFELVVEPEGTETGPPEGNTIYRAHKLLAEIAGDELPVRVRLRKRIPTGAGLGGGSSDAAATLVGLNEIFGLGLSDTELKEVGLKIGADVPFCIGGGTALGRGVGEVLSTLPAPPPHYLVVAKPAAGAGTARIYRAYDERPGESKLSVVPVVEALRAGDLGALAKGLGNDLARVTKGLVPGVQWLEEELLRAGALGVAMSGTGTAVYALFGFAAEARDAERSLRAPFVLVCEPVARGVVMFER